MHGVDMGVCGEVMIDGGDRVDAVPPEMLSEIRVTRSEKRKPSLVRLGY